MITRCVMMKRMVCSSLLHRFMIEGESRCMSVMELRIYITDIGTYICVES